jgi:hypothetical protein
MVEILKFSRETAFTPETIQILAAALDEAWERFRQSGSRLARPAYSRAMREEVAKRIMEMAQRGMQDREAIANTVSQSSRTMCQFVVRLRDCRVIFVCATAKKRVQS